MELFRNKIIAALVFLTVLIASCKMGEAVVVVGVAFEPIQEYNYEHEKGEWTVMVYMPADNEMEKEAVADINEMEAADIDFEANHVIVLVDGNNQKENYGGEWNGTRLYEINHDKNGVDDKIVSLRLGCKELNLSAKKECELDMSDPDVLEKFVSSTAKYYPADHYAFVMWGECSGYSGKTQNARAVAFDDTSVSYMDNRDFALSLYGGLGKKFDLLAMDSCFGSELELLTEFKGCAEYFTGMEGIQKLEGWNYRSLLNVFTGEFGDGKTLGEALVLSQGEKNISLVDLSDMDALLNAFDLFAQKFSSSIKSNDAAVKIRNEILGSEFCFRTYESSLNPVYVDVKSLAEKYGGDDLASCVEKTCMCKNPDYGGIGVFLCNMDENQNLVESIPDDYVRNKDNCTFVEKSAHYVFTQDKSGTLLDKLFGNYY